jgi:hypothetical protein
MRNIYSMLIRRRFIRITLSALTISLIAGGALLAAANQRFQVQTSVEAILCERDEKGGWVTIDRGKDSSSFESTASEIASRREFASNFVWRGRSEKGCQVDARQSRPVAEKWDKTSGVYELSVPAEFIINGKTFNVNYTSTTETLNTPIGQISGRKATWTDNTLSAGLVGLVKFRARPSLFNCARRSIGSGKDASSSDAEKEFAVILKNTGTYTLKK